MGNRFTNEKLGHTWLEKSLKLSNGATSVLIDALILSASDIADTEWQKLFTCWIAGHDQSTIGIGQVGFDINEIGWTKDNFEAEKDFVLQIIDLAIQKHRWDDLNYTPADFMIEKLRAFRELVALYEQSFIEKDNDWGASYIEPDMDFTLCPKHHVYMHPGGCHICNQST